MDQKGWPIVFSIIAAFVLLLPRGAATPPDEPKKSEETAVESTKQENPELVSSAPEPECHRWCEPIRLYEEFFGLPSSSSLGPVVAAASRLSYKLNVLIALIPDPLDAGLSNRSDEALDAIQRGFADAGHLFDRQGLLWQGEAAKNRLAREEPGALLFRRFKSSQKSRELTLVLLVGETPKGGIHKEAFREALALAERLRSSANNPGGPIRILGPTFSGSAESLRIALRDRLDFVGPPVPPVYLVQFKIVTGSATAPGVEKIAEDFGGNVVLERTVVTDDELEREAYRYFQDKLGWDFRDVALLIELDTGYGRGALQRAASGGGPVPGFLVEFPSHLSRLRTAREKKGLRRKDTEPEIAETSRRLLDLSLSEEDREPIDIVPQASSLSTAADDLALSYQLQVICREGARYVGIVATDIQDRLFLAEQVRSHCPDVVLFTFDNHLLSSHPRLMKTTEGALIVSSFPLRITNPAGESRALRLRRHYTSEIHQGIVRAVHHLLGKQVEQAHPWIVAVGQGQLWPVARLGEQAPERDLVIAGTEEVTFKWIAVSLAMGLLASWLWRTSRRIQSLEQEICLPAGGLPGVRLYPLAGLGALALASAVLLVFYALPLWRTEEFLTLPERPGLLIAWWLNLLSLAGLYAGLIVCGASLAQRAFRRGFDRRVVMGWTAGAVLLLLAVRALFVVWIPQGERFFYARAGDFASGLSPLVSLACLLAAVYTWALLGIRSRRLSLIQGVLWPLSSDLEKEPLATCGTLARKLDSLLCSWSPNLWFWGGLTAVLLLPLRRLWGIQPIAEHAVYGWIFLTLVALGFILAVIAFSRFVLLWRKLEQILELLCNTWLLDAFKKSSAFFDWKPLRSFGWRMPRHKMSLLSAEVLRSLTKQGVRGADGAPLVAEDDLDREIGAVIHAEREGNLVAEILVRQDLQRLFGRSADTLERALPQLPSGNGTVAEIEKYLALRVVCWIRYAFGQLRYSLLSALTCGLFVLVGVSAYAFQPKRFLSFGIWAFLLPASLLALLIFVRMDRNTVLSAISGSDAGKVSLDRTFYSNLFTYVGIPVIGVILTQFPALGHLLGDWLQPLMRLLTAS